MVNRSDTCYSCKYYKQNNIICHKCEKIIITIYTKWISKNFKK